MMLFFYILFFNPCSIPLDAIFERGSISTMAYNVVDQDGEFRGEIRASLTFRPEVIHSLYYFDKNKIKAYFKMLKEFQKKKNYFGSKH